ncbi:S8 family peptidase, partial [bacterium]|nr:S8 family peptidase [bacterium]
FVATDSVIDNSSSYQPIPTNRHWVFLERPELNSNQLDRAIEGVANGLTPRSLNRRRKCITHEPPVRICDLPIDEEQIAVIESTGCRVVSRLRYINAITVTGSDQALDEVSRLRFVKDVKPVMSYPSLDNEIDNEIYPVNYKSHHNRNIDDAEVYGQSWTQNRLVNVPAVHDRGYRGRGVLIGVQDTGFNNLNHIAFNNLNVVAAYDFLNNDNNVTDHGDHGSGSHGTRTLSIIAGLDSGYFIGVAPEADFVLTKTENTESETRVEEDYWIAGLWFHDSLGVDVLSSSLSYRAWYNWDDMDGQTALTSIAADSAVSAGMVIVSSTGNTGRSNYPYSKIGAPADTRGVIGVGGVTRDSSYWSGSSQGPTYDGRIKPNVSAQSSVVYTATTFNDTIYTTHNGTSFSTPTLAGIVALMLEANPWLTPADVMRILQGSSSQADSPDTLVGYGIPDALAAVRAAEAGVNPDDVILPEGFMLTVYPNPFNSTATIRYCIPYSSYMSLQLFNISGQQINTFFEGNRQAGFHSINLNLGDLSSGLYFVSLNCSGQILTEKLILIK